MKRKLSFLGVLLIACMCSLMSYIYICKHDPRDIAFSENVIMIDKPFQEKPYLPEVQFLRKVIKTILEVADFK